MNEEWRLGDARMSALGVASSVGVFVGAGLAGFMSDRMGRTFIFKRTLVISAVALGLLAVAVNYTMALVVMAILGLGVGGDLVIAGTAFSEFCPLSRHRALALLSTTWNKGSRFGVGLAWVLTATKVDFIHMWRLYCL